MEHVGRVKVLYCAQQVVDDELNMLELQVDGRLDDLLQVALCEFEHHIQRLECLEVLRLHDIE